MTTFLEAEIRTQPDDWLAAPDLAQEQRALLPVDGERVVVIGCGTSLHMARAYASLREQRGQGITDAWTPTQARTGRSYDRVLMITRSGTTTEILDLLGTGLPDRVPTTVITASAGHPVEDFAPTLVQPHLEEQSVVQTRFATGTLALLRAALGDELGIAATQARLILEGGLTDERLIGADQITFVGQGWASGLASEAALKLRESCRAWAEAYPMTEYRHGPISISSEGRVVWALGELVAGLAQDVRATGALLCATDNDPLAELVRVQLLCVARAAALGLDPDHPRHLTRSIILPATR